MMSYSIPAPRLQSGASQVFMRKDGSRCRLLRPVTPSVTGSVADNPLKYNDCYDVTLVTPITGLHVCARAHTYIKSCNIRNIVTNELNQVVNCYKGVTAIKTPVTQDFFY